MTRTAPHREWFDEPWAPGDKPGLRFSCTQCGNCCSGVPGFVSFTPDEARRIADRLGVSEEEFVERYTRDTPEGRSIIDRLTPFGFDCVFLDRTTRPGKSLCAIYEERPRQCRTWPFWTSNLVTEEAWRRAARTCPGMNRGDHFTPMQIRVVRDEDGP